MSKTQRRAPYVSRPNISIIPHIRPKVVVEKSINSLYNLRIDRAPFFGYTKARERQKNTNNQDEVGQERGLIPMANDDTPPVSQMKIDAERNESKDLVSK